mmetsp:Transcript_15903/g.39322  ORF Transcript_15903/g.39322 Transcript_15903/m.39322 type:complete len:451 (+) Transcript_15903:6959-8311(+)
MLRDALRRVRLQVRARPRVEAELPRQVAPVRVTGDAAVHVPPDRVAAVALRPQQPARDVHEGNLGHAVHGHQVPEFRAVKAARERWLVAPVHNRDVVDPVPILSVEVERQPGVSAVRRLHVAHHEPVLEHGPGRGVPGVRELGHVPHPTRLDHVEIPVVAVVAQLHEQRRAAMQRRELVHVEVQVRLPRGEELDGHAAADGRVVQHVVVLDGLAREFALGVEAVAKSGRVPDVGLPDHGPVHGPVGGRRGVVGEAEHHRQRLDEDVVAPLGLLLVAVLDLHVVRLDQVPDVALGDGEARAVRDDPAHERVVDGAVVDVGLVHVDLAARAHLVEVRAVAPHLPALPAVAHFHVLEPVLAAVERARVHAPVGEVGIGRSLDHDVSAQRADVRPQVRDGVHRIVLGEVAVARRLVVVRERLPEEQHRDLLVGRGLHLHDRTRPAHRIAHASAE